MFFFLSNIFTRFVHKVQHFYERVMLSFIGQNGGKIPGRLGCYLYLFKEEKPWDFDGFFEVTKKGNRDQVILIFLPFEGFLPEHLYEQIRQMPEPRAVFLMTHVEMVIPALTRVCRNFRDAPAIFVVGASLVPIKTELNQSLFSQKGRNLRQKTFEKVFRELKFFHRTRRIDLTIIDYIESLGPKNSALLRRLFS